MPTLIRSASHPQRATRHGRALVECLIATVLLSVAALAMSATAQASATLVDDATLVARAQWQAGAAAERALLRPCDIASPSSVVDGARVRSVIRDAASPGLQSRAITTTLAPSPFAQRDTQQLALTTARVCP